MPDGHPIPTTHNFQDLTGQVFGDWLVVRFDGRRRETSQWWCRCVCGTERAVGASNLKRGLSQGCGCQKSAKIARRFTTHGRSRTAEHRTWVAMRQRCHNPKASKYADYGGRGIRVCARWRISFQAFLADVGPKPGPAYSLERVNNNGHYEPGNVRWATPREQCLNKRNNRVVTFRGIDLPLSEWCRRVGLNMHTVIGRLGRGWVLDRALSEPVP